MIDHRLRVLRAVAVHGTVTGAARALSYTPSAVSHQLRSLGRDLEVTLLEPEGRGVRLTAAAQLLLERTDDLFARWEEVRAELAETETESVTSLRVCGFATAAAALLPLVATRVRAAYPQCTVRITEADPSECFNLLLAEQADLAVVVAVPSLPPSNDPRFEQATLLEDPLDLLVPEDHPLARQPAVALRDAAEEPWIMDRPGRPLYQLAVSACAAAGFSPAHAHEAEQWETGAALVDAGFGVTLIPRLARLHEGYRVVRVPLRGDPTPSRRILTAVRRGSRRQPAITTALAALAEAAA